MVITPTAPAQIDLKEFAQFKEEVHRVQVVDGKIAQELALKATHVAFLLSEQKAGVFHYAENAEVEAKRLLAQAKLNSEGGAADKRDAEARTNEEYNVKMREVAQARAAQYHLQEAFDTVQSLHYFFKSIYQSEFKVNNTQNM